MVIDDATAGVATTSEADAFGVDAADRAAAHRALDRWLDECQHSAIAGFNSGRSGYIGRIKLCAFVSDDGISLRIEQSQSEDL